MIDKSKKRKLNSAPKWDAKFDKRIAEIRSKAIKNNNFILFALTSEEIKNGQKLSGVHVCSNFNVVRAAKAFIDQIPEEVLSMVLMERLLKGKSK